MFRMIYFQLKHASAHGNGLHAIKKRRSTSTNPTTVAAAVPCLQLLLELKSTADGRTAPTAVYRLLHFAYN